MKSPCIVFAMNNRPAQSRLFMLGFKRLKKHYPALCAIAGVTEQADIDLCVENEILCMSRENIPALKMNDALRVAYHLGHSHFIIMADDDLLSNDGFDLLFKASMFHDYAGFKTNAFYDMTTGKAMAHTQPYKSHKLCGAGRVISRRAIGAVCDMVDVEGKKDYPPITVGGKMRMRRDVAEYLHHYQSHVVPKADAWVNLWPDGLRRGLDHHSELRLALAGFPPVSVDDTRIHLTDFKCEPNDNIWPYSIIENKCKPVDADRALWFLGDEEMEYLNTFNK